MKTTSARISIPLAVLAAFMVAFLVHADSVTLGSPFWVTSNWSNSTSPTRGAQASQNNDGIACPGGSVQTGWRILGDSAPYSGSEYGTQCRRPSSAVTTGARTWITSNWSNSTSPTFGAQASPNDGIACPGGSVQMGWRIVPIDPGMGVYEYGTQCQPLVSSATLGAPYWVTSDWSNTTSPTRGAQASANNDGIACPNGSVQTGWRIIETSWSDAYAPEGSGGGYSSYEYGTQCRPISAATINPPPPPPPPPPPSGQLSCNITFDQNPLTGSNTVMRWISTGANLFFINNVGYVPASGSAQVSQTGDYSGTVSGTGGANSQTYSTPGTYTAPRAGAVTITVIGGGGGGGGSGWEDTPKGGNGGSGAATSITGSFGTVTAQGGTGGTSPAGTLAGGTITQAGVCPGGGPCPAGSWATNGGTGSTQTRTVTLAAGEQLNVSIGGGGGGGGAAGSVNGVGPSGANGTVSTSPSGGSAGLGGVNNCQWSSMAGHSGPALSGGGGGASSGGGGGGGAAADNGSYGCANGGNGTAGTLAQGGNGGIELGYYKWANTPPGGVAPGGGGTGAPYGGAGGGGGAQGQVVISWGEGNGNTASCTAILRGNSCQTGSGSGGTSGGTSGPQKSVFSTPGQYTFTVPNGVTSINYLVVGGGGGGGGDYGGPQVYLGASGQGGYSSDLRGMGGGGAGGVRTGTITPTSGQEITVVVGTGGTAGASGRTGGKGGDSKLGSIVGHGGGGGGSSDTGGGAGNSGPGLSGGSGGGGGGAGINGCIGAGYPAYGSNGNDGNLGGTGNVGGYSPPEGYNGGKGSGYGTCAGGGGGGGGGAGGSTTSTDGTGASGGAGITSSITGTNVTYACGGGGGAAAAGGCSSAGRGASAPQGSGGNALPGSGSGGGGSAVRTNGGAANGGTGGGGMVVLSWTGAPASGSSGGGSGGSGSSGLTCNPVTGNLTNTCGETIACPEGCSVVTNQCITTSCPAGFVRQNGQCVRVTCPEGWTLSGNACIPPPNIGFNPFDAFDRNGNPFRATGHLQAIPALVRQGDTTRVFWNVSNARVCTVTGTNGDGTLGSITGIWNTLSSGEDGKTTSPIIGSTIYTLRCTALLGATPASVQETATVNILPTFQEQ